MRMSTQVQVSSEAKLWSQIYRIGVTGSCGHLTWVLGTEPQSPAGAASVLDS